MIIIVVCVTSSIFAASIYFFIKSADRRRYGEHFLTTLVGTFVGFTLVTWGHTYLQGRDQRRQVVSQIVGAYYEIECNKDAIDELLESGKSGVFHQDVELREITFENLKILFQSPLTYTRITSPQFKFRVSDLYGASKQMKSRFNTVRKKYIEEYTETRENQLATLKERFGSFQDWLQIEASDIWESEWSQIKGAIERAKTKPTF